MSKTFHKSIRLRPLSGEINRKFGWCIGAFDDTPALCDECANIVQSVE